ncbi:serine/threonine-protein kinase [Paenibacillus sp. YYML68]|uniref:serine/threonine-protein kinase n=1 Tax=Paenibacillus sp. YYML68 TaxID=2909250 RepID=UPI002493C6E9|nr:protein kinase [Paenibacillus sp. YYML68]
MHNTPNALQTGTLVAERYRILAPLGSGGMSRVWLAEDLKLRGKRWAVKELNWCGAAAAGGVTTEEEHAVWRRLMAAEAETMSRLSHPSLPHIIDVVPNHASGRLYLIMDFIEGETVQARFQRQGCQMDVHDVIDMALQLCGLLEYLHSIQPEPVIHRDLKPSNLMIDAAGKVRLIDFGTARSFKVGRANDTVNLGTIGFAAPEQFEADRQSDPRTDLYGVGALMYYLLCGGLHYHPARPMEEAEQRIPPALRRIVQRLLRADPDERFRSAAETAAALCGCQVELAGKQPGQRTALTFEPSAGPGGVGLVWTPPRIIAVGGLYSGAGATFTTLVLAQALDALEVPHAVIEPPGHDAELAALLTASRRSSSHRRSYQEELELGAATIGHTYWQSGHTLWLPAASDELSAWKQRDEVTLDTAGSWLKLFHTLRRPVVIVDIGADWERPAVQALLETATDLIYVADPLIHKLQQAACSRRLRLLYEGGGHPVHASRRTFAFANKCVSAGDKWLKLLPEPPACQLPAVSFDEIVEACWKGQLPSEHPRIRAATGPLVQSWLRKWLPTDGVTPERSSGAVLVKRALRSWFS